MKIVCFNCPECGKQLEDFKMLASDNGKIPLRVFCPDCVVYIHFEATAEDLLDLAAGKPVYMHPAEPETAETEIVM